MTYSSPGCLLMMMMMFTQPVLHTSQPLHQSMSSFRVFILQIFVKFVRMGKASKLVPRWEECGKDEKRSVTAVCRLKFRGDDKGVCIHEYEVRDYNK